VAKEGHSFKGRTSPRSPEALAGRTPGVEVFCLGKKTSRKECWNPKKVCQRLLAQGTTLEGFGGDGGGPCPYRDKSGGAPRPFPRARGDARGPVGGEGDAGRRTGAIGTGSSGPILGANPTHRESRLWAQLWVLRWMLAGKKKKGTLETVRPRAGGHVGSRFEELAPLVGASFFLGIQVRTTGDSREAHLPPLLAG